MNFDKIDIAILSNLQKHGRMTNVELAKRAGISAPPCLRRLKLMEKQGAILSYHAEINPEFTGFSIKAFCTVTLVSQASPIVNDFLKIVEKEPNIRTCFSTSGNELFILSIVAKDLREYEKVLKNKLQNSNVVSSITSHIVLNTHKSEFGIPIETICIQKK
ncbi:MAG: Lrp/AsnC family transcriptional regulator [Alphaproteobacteria bacterium]|nr:Lrp/AsnC family transcriptional regulator [Alphaproteobacteria bacterium]